MKLQPLLFALALLGGCQKGDSSNLSLRAKGSSAAISAPSQVQPPSAVDSGSAPAPLASRKQILMQIVIPDSSSSLLRATNVFLIELQAVRAGDWAPADVGGIVRSVDVDAKLVAIFKGKLVEPPGAVVRVALPQFGTGLSRISGAMGIWSYHDLKVGARFIVMSEIAIASASQIRGELGRQNAEIADRVLADVELAAQVEDQSLNVWKAIALARSIAPKLEGIFFEYLWARFESAALADEKTFELFADLMEQPSLGRGARAELVLILGSVGGREPPARKQTARLAAAYFRLLSMPESAPLHDNLVGTDLPNLLDLAAPTRAPGAPGADAIFHDYPGERAKARSALQAYRGTESTARLLAWINH